jgi:hypothetical protein
MTAELGISADLMPALLPYHHRFLPACLPAWSILVNCHACSLMLHPPILHSQLVLLSSLRSRVLQVTADTAQQLPGLAAIPNTQQQSSGSSSSSREAGVMSAADSAVWEMSLQQLQQLLAVFVRVHHAMMTSNGHWSLDNMVRGYLSPR